MSKTEEHWTYVSFIKCFIVNINNLVHKELFLCTKFMILYSSTRLHLVREDIFTLCFLRWILTCYSIVLKMQAPVYEYSVSPIYRGRVYRGIGYIAVACWTPFFGAQERDIFREIAVTPWTQFAGDNFSRNLLTAIAFVPGSQETIFREINSSLPVNTGWNTCCATVSHVRRSIDTSIVS